MTIAIALEDQILFASYGVSTPAARRLAIDVYHAPTAPPPEVSLPQGIAFLAIARHSAPNNTAPKPTRTP